MSDINLDFTVSNNSIDFTVQPNDITITPTDIQLTFSTNSLPLAGGSNTQLQYNNSDLLGGIPTATYDGTNLSLGNVANLKILGGTNGYVLQTDGSGNLDWTAMSGGGGNGTPGGSNTQIQYNDAGAFGGNTGFTFNEITGNVAIPGNLSVVGNIIGNAQTANFATYSNLANYATTAYAVAGANVSGQVSNSLVAGTVYTNAQPNITSVGTLSNLSVNGSISSNNANLGNLTTSNYFLGDGSLLTNISISGGTFIANGTSNINIPTINGNIIFGIAGTNNVITVSSTMVSINANIETNGVFTGNGFGLTNLPGANVTGTVANATYALNAGSASIATRAGTVTTNAQPNITSVGNLTDLRINNSIIHLGANAGISQGGNAIAIGNNAGYGQLFNAVAIGANAGYAQGNQTVAIGSFAGTTNQSNGATAVGSGAGQTSQGLYAIAVGQAAAETGQGANCIAIGYYAGGNYQLGNSIAIGRLAGSNTQGQYSIAFGYQAARENQGANSIAIGANAGYTSQSINSIVLNATGANLNTTQANSLFVKPIRDVTGNVDFTVTLKYNPTTGEIGYV